MPIYKKIDRSAVVLDVAPSMGSFEEGIAAFQSPEPPYGRGGGTPATKYLQQEVLQYLARYTVTEGVLAPSVMIAPNGQAANHGLFRALLGNDLVPSKHLFGTTKAALSDDIEDLGKGEIAWVNPCNTQEFIDATTSSTVGWFLEAISNPAGRVPDFDSLRKAANDCGVLLMLDATLAVGMPNFRPLDYADVVTVSLTKQAGGGDNLNMGGAVIVNHNIDWPKHTHKLRGLTRHFSDAAGNLCLPDNPLGALIAKIGLRAGTNSIVPSVALSIADSLPYLNNTVERMCQNAKMLAELLEGHAKIERVRLAGYNTDTKNDERTRRYLGPNHFVLLADLKGGSSATRDFINTRKIFHAVALGQKKTAQSNPASSTHRNYAPTDLEAIDIHTETIRISVGCEEPDALRDKVLRSLDF